MSMQNFPKIPKITLIKPADEAKDAKNAKQKKKQHTLNVTLKPMARESKKHMLPASSDESRSISLAWGMEYNKLEPAPKCESRGMGSQLWHD